MTWLVAEALFYLIRTDLLMHRQGIAALHLVLTELSPSSRSVPCCRSDRICRAADIASVLYFKRVLCLQGSAATTMLLRRHGFAAQLVIGARIVPFKSHAWVELDGVVLNDKPYTPQLYSELERC
jgi:Transglutaminase-like superfamily